MGYNTDELKEWMIQYLKHKDIFLKSIKEIKPGNHENEVCIEYRDKKQLIIIEPVLSEVIPLFEAIKENKADADSFLLAVYNTKDNLNRLVEYWSRFAQLPNLSIYFVNPDSQTDKRWIVCPYTHSRIADSDSLKAGLKSMFSTVEHVRANKLKKGRK
jgi:hypothetical protein